MTSGRGVSRVFLVAGLLEDWQSGECSDLLGRNV